MNSANFTHKAQQAIIQAQSIARQRGQQQIDALHLLLSLLSQEESIVLTLLRKLGTDIEGLKKKTQNALNTIPTVTTPQPFGQFYLTQDMAKVLDKARQEALKMSDEFISVEHLFLGLLDSQTKAKEILDKAPFLKGADLLVVADCVPVSYSSFHQDFLKGKAVMMGCPKLDDVQEYIDKFADIFKTTGIKSITTVIVEVPCCSGLPMIVKKGLEISGQKIPMEEVVISTRGKILKQATG